MRLNFPLFLCALAAHLVPHSALAADAGLDGQRLYATCANCHGTNGVSAGGPLPTLAGQPKEALVESLKAFRAGTRPATIMHQIAKGYTDEQIETIAAYLAEQEK
ncbi:MAG: cytochrome c-like protein [Noviherbaspirillum sp.]|jgi:sulfide dehydrogenase cytochrome subunit|nr:cytochrome c-like protein [Noviherbaspirillum sp.]